MSGGGISTTTDSESRSVEVSGGGTGDSTEANVGSANGSESESELTSLVARGRAVATRCTGVTPRSVGCLGRFPGGRLDSEEVRGEGTGGRGEGIRFDWISMPAAWKNVSSSGIEPSVFHSSSPRAI